MRKLYLMLAFGAILPAATQNASAAYPTADEIQGRYKMTADLKLEKSGYNSWLTSEVIFTLEPGYEGPTINGFLSNQPASTVYNDLSGELTITTVTLRDGDGYKRDQLGRPVVDEKGNPVPNFRYLGYSDNEGNWNGMAALYSIKPVWKISENGDIVIPEFTVVDYSSYNTTKKVDIVARYSNITVEKIDDEYQEPEHPEIFYGTYNFVIGKTTEWVYEMNETTGKVELVEERTFTDTPIQFTINEYFQMWTFGDYELWDEQLNSLRNRGYLDGLNKYVMDVDTYNGVEWIYVAEEDNYHTDAKLFGNVSDPDWYQGRVAFVLTKNDDGTYSLPSFSLYQRTMEEVEGEPLPDGTPVNNMMRIFRMINKWENWKFVSYSPEINGKTYEDAINPDYVDPVDPEEPTVDPDDPTVDPDDPTVNPDDPTVNPDDPTKEPGEDNPDNPQGPNDPVNPDQPEGPENSGDAGVSSIYDGEGAVRYFNLQGVEIANPAKGAIVIRIEGGKAKKVIM